MSQPAKGIFIDGVVEDVEHKAGTGDYGPYDYHVVYVHVGRQVVEVRWDSNSEGPRPSVGQHVSIQVNMPKGAKAFPARRVVTAPAIKTA
jgi:hypothetical protein